jgi:hypothetical protein
MSKLSEAIKEMVESTPETIHFGEHNIGAKLEDAFKEAGYSLELHQHGIAGTTIMATKLEI